MQYLKLDQIQDTQITNKTLLVSQSNQLQYKLEQNNDEYVISVSRKNIFIAQLSIKTQFTSIPQVFQTSESGYWLAFSFSDSKIMKGEFYLIILTNKKKLVAKKFKQVSKPITAVNFLNIYKQYALNIPEKIESVSPEFILGNSIGEVFACQYESKDLKLQVLTSLKASTILSFRQTAPNRILNITTQHTKDHLFIMLVSGITFKLYQAEKQSILLLKLKSPTQNIELDSILINNKIPNQLFSISFTNKTFNFYWLTGGNKHSFNFHELKINYQTNELTQLRGYLLNQFSDSKIIGFQTFDFLSIIYCEKSIFIVDLVNKQIIDSQAARFSQFTNSIEFGEFELFKFPKPGQQGLSKKYARNENFVQVSFKDETFHLWKSYLYTNDYENALKYAKTEQQIYQVQDEYSIHLIDRCEFYKAASVLAEMKCNMLVKYQELTEKQLLELSSMYIELKMQYIFEHFNGVYQPEKDEADYNQLSITYEKSQKQKYIVVQLYIQSLINVIRHKQQQIKSLKMNLNSLYQVENSFKINENSSQIMEIEDIITEFQDKLLLFVTNKQNHTYEYILDKVAKNSLLAYNLPSIYAKYSVSKQNYEFPVNFFIQFSDFNRIVEIYRDSNITFILKTLQQVIPHKPMECFDLLQRFINEDPFKFPYQEVSQIITSQLPTSANHFIKLATWYILTFQGKNLFFIKFITQNLQQLHEENLVIQILSTPNLGLDYSEILKTAKKESNEKVQVQALYMLRNYFDALQLQFSFASQIQFSSLRNTELTNETPIIMGSFEGVFELFSNVLTSLRVDKISEKRDLHHQLFGWFMKIDVLGASPEQLFGVKFKQLQRVFRMVEMSSFLTLTDCLNFIPKNFTMSSIQSLIQSVSAKNDQRMKKNDAEMEQCERILVGGQKKAVKIVSLQKEIVCQKCKRAMQDQVVLFPCCHGWHKKCLNGTEECPVCSEKAIEDLFKGL